MLLTAKKLRVTFLVFTLSLSLVHPLASTTDRNRGSSPTEQTHGPKQIEHWLDFDFDERQPMGSAQNPAVIMPGDVVPLLGTIYGAKPVGDTVFVPASELQRIANNPLAAAVLAPVFSQLTNLKSFDGFSAVDMTGLIKGLPTEFHERSPLGGPAAKGNTQASAGLLQNGDIIFGSHVVNYVTWGRYNHAAIVTDAAQGMVMESTADPPSDKPGVRSIDWKTFASSYVHVGVVRVKGLTSEQVSRVIRWVEQRKGKPYRWPIIGGLNRTDDSRVYCSQLVWLAYLQVLNIDLDYDQGVLIFPDDIYYSKQHVNVIVP